MGAGSNGQGSGGGNGGTGGNPQGNKPSGSGAQNTTTRKVSFYIDYNEEPAPGETLRFIEKGFDIMPSPAAGPQPYGGNKRSRTIMHARGVKLGPGRAIIKHLGSRRLRQVPAGESSAGVSIGY